MGVHHQHFEENLVGEDFVVGDLHGHFSDLVSQLRVAGFDETKDRVFALGDLIDRGPESHRALEFLAKPWFFSIRGNHDQMLLDAHANPVESTGPYGGGSSPIKMWMVNGGDWARTTLLGWENEDEFDLWASEFSQLPHLFSVEHKGKKFGMVHAEMPINNFADFAEEIRAQLEEQKDRDNSDFIHAVKSVEWALWARTYIQKANTFFSYLKDPQDRLKEMGEELWVEDMDFLLSGHTPLPTLAKMMVSNPAEPFFLGNRVYMDAGKFFTHDSGGKLILKKLSDF